ncbi:MAG: alpha/beta hydrolase-fold protein, partial [Phycisphaerae bacterium]
MPAEKHADASLFLSGSLAELGDWRSDGRPLKRDHEGRHRTTLKLPIGRVVEYKVTRGGWDTVEKGEGGGERPNRRLEVDADALVEIEVLSWSDQPVEPVAEAPPGTEAQAPAVITSTLTGDIRFHHDFASGFLRNQRMLAVYLPPGYEDEPGRRYPVVYMHDGQNVFDASMAANGVEWRADETAERLIRAGRIEPIIIVGIYNNHHRESEYTPYYDAVRGVSGRGRNYARFVAGEVKPFMDQHYRTLGERRHTAVVGSSLGGLISLYICMEHPDLFSMCGAMSPTLLWDRRRILRDMRGRFEILRQCRFWVDMGTAESSDPAELRRMLGDIRGLSNILTNAGLRKNRDFRHEIVPGGEHNEAAWAARFGRLLEFFYGRKSA